MSGQTKKILGIHAGLVFAEVICASAFIVELHRATSGNQLSWAYVFEWPILGLYGVYVWRKLLAEERDPASQLSLNEPLNQEIEKSRSAYNAYLSRVHQESSPTEESPE